jgi:hypothetical protein
VLFSRIAEPARHLDRERRRGVTMMARKPRDMRAAKPVVSEEGGVEQYAAAFARVRLVRAWIAAAAALVALLYGYVALLERVVVIR